MKRSLLLLGTAGILLLAACNKSAGITLREQLNFRTSDQTRIQQLTDASVRVIEARLAASQKKLVSFKLDKSGGNTVLSLTVPDQATADLLQQELSAPFKLRIMSQVPTGQGDLSTDKYGDFKETGITEKSVDWVQPGLRNGKGAVVIKFTPEGATAVNKVFADNQGKLVGVFVRDRLMSAKTADKTDNKGSIAIDGIPSPEVASIFADDVNTGVYVTFAQVK